MTPANEYKYHNIAVIAWVSFNILLGILGWGLHDPKLYQPLYAWIIGTLLFENILVILLIILASSLTSLIFFGRHTDVIAEAAGRKPLSTPASETTFYIITLVQYLAVNGFMLYLMIYRPC
jgi:hypothetical protein